MRAARSFLLLTAAFSGSCCRCVFAAPPDAAFLSALSGAIVMSRPIFICDWGNTTLRVRRGLLRDLGLGTASLRSNLPNDSDRGPFRVGSGYVCMDHLGPHSVSAFLNQTPEVGLTEPWIVAVSTWPLVNHLDPGLFVAVNRRVYILALDTATMYEAYTINEVAVAREIGSFSSRNEFSVKAESSLTQRRSANLMGQQLRVFVDEQPPFNIFTQDAIKNLPNVKTDSGDVLELVDGSKLDGIFFRVLSDLRRAMNFTYVLYRREDRKWGSQDANGTLDGMISTMQKGEGDLIAASLTMRAYRHRGVDFLIPLGTETYAIFIKRVFEENLDWTLYGNPFKMDLWKFLFVYSLACTVAIKALEVAVNKDSDQSMIGFAGDLINIYWIAFRSNLGGQPPAMRGDKVFSFRAMLFAIFFVANIVFMCYRASLTSELSNRKVRMPFYDLEGVLHSDFQLIVMGNGITGAMFINAQEGTVFDWLYKKFLEGQESLYTFPSFEESLKNLLLMKRAVLYDVMESVFSIEEARCEVLMPWKTDYPDHLGMALPKNSPYYELLRYQTLRQMEVGSFRAISSRMKRGEPVCGGHSFSIALGFEKLVSVFAILCAGYALSTTICAAEVFAGCGGDAMLRQKEKSFMYDGRQRETEIGAWIKARRRRRRSY